MIFVIPKLRGTDAQGSGAYGAPRGSRTHKGVDYAAKPGTPVYSAVRGRVTRLGYPYKGNKELRLIEIKVGVPGENGDLVRYMYVEPLVTKGAIVGRGDCLGTVQRLPYKGITQHVHVDVKQMVDKRRKFVNPVEYFEEYWYL